ncbi:hypothetical protein HDF26_002784 [Pedobacter cryoconitis]|uniref:DUF2059 domain-containing protein n=1 Tax=Pedobacter cryoconitis TaxID=188932 RepID=A0A7W8ZI97_9SPHI|nr:DUF2059 domain-containing protein [Pedobacter cryoconitis]MBB5634546.1 hypothetical protein [Pedobacter cryoconitis]MBB6272327.1 hypothetical protein [Pedobacter cryoconitis]
MKTIILLFSLILLTATLSFGQDNTAYRESVKQMMIANGTENTFKAIISQMMTTFKAQKTEVKAEVWTEFETSFQKVGIEDLLDLLSPIYQKHLSKEDIDSITAFYKTPAGKKFAEKTPVIMQESMQAGRMWGEKIGADIMNRLTEKGY